MVCKEDYEIRHPSDFLRVQKEKIAVNFSRPYPAQDVFIGVSCSVTQSTGRAEVGTADCARVEYTPSQSIDDEGLNWIYKDLYPAQAGLALAGESTSGVIHSLRPGV